jgi:hypothetical protein
MTLLVLRDATRDQSSQGGDSEASTYRQYPHDRIEQRTGGDERYQAEVESHQREAT